MGFPAVHGVSKPSKTVTRRTVVHVMCSVTGRESHVDAITRATHGNAVSRPTDAARAGDSGAADLLCQSRRARRVKVPQGGDLCEFRRQGGDLAAWLAFCLATMEA